MIRQRSRRLVTIFTAAALALMLVGVGATSAAPPRWVMTVDKLPDTASLSTATQTEDAGYRVTITNLGPSNIAKLFLVSDRTAQPSFISTPTQGSCNPTGALSCSFGTLVARSSVSVIVAWAVPTSGTEFGVAFLGTANGATVSDGGTSHGDFLRPTPAVTTTALSNNSNFKGRFVINNGLLQTNQNLGNNPSNKQSTELQSPESLIGATIEDGITSGVPCTITECAGLFGEWSRLNVAANKDYAPAGTPFKVTLRLIGVAGNPDTADIHVVHSRNDGSSYVIDTQCTPATGTPTNAECLLVTKSGNTYTIVVWLFQNGAVRGGV